MPMTYAEVLAKLSKAAPGAKARRPNGVEFRKSVTPEEKANHVYSHNGELTPEDIEATDWEFVEGDKGSSEPRARASVDSNPYPGPSQNPSQGQGDRGASQAPPKKV